ncbi:MFS transporter [Alicyclobacillus sp. ALC3]|uniref:MFS transporter n=1 Tax=Alicyclobacillus sp. ALC3 TaxID=2796143 RepID=UPI0023782AAB|nr:MFS transporter [Alicyclobacillus sp. ALC3]WDL95933.1 MFS transporter [Alicyclobacillus sp. ALC3]
MTSTITSVGHGVQQTHSARARWIALAVLCLSLIVIALDATIVNVATSTISTKLHTSENQLQWIVDAYTLVFAALLLTCGNLADRFGRRTGLIVGLTVFGAGSFAAALSTSAAQLIVFRGGMGLGAAFIMPATLSSISHLFRNPVERTRALSIWSATLGIGAVLGPLIGGKLLQAYSWESVFWVNIPIAVIGIALALMYVPNSKHKAGRIDIVGLVISILALGSLVWAIIEGPVKGWGTLSIVWAFVVAALALAAFVLWELKTDHPLLPMHFFKNPRFSMATLSISTAYFGLMGALFLSTQFIQSVLGNNPLQTGLRVAPEALSIAVFALVAEKLVHRAGTKFTVVGGLVIMAVGLLLLSLTPKGTAYMHLLPALICLGAGIGATMAACEDSVIGSLPQGQMGTGTAVNSTLIQVGSTIGVAVFGSLENTLYQKHMIQHVQGLRLPPGIATQMTKSISITNVVANHLGTAYSATVHGFANSAFIHGFDRASLVGCFAALAAAVLALAWLPARHRAPHKQSLDQEVGEVL